MTSFILSSIAATFGLLMLLFGLVTFFTNSGMAGLGPFVTGIVVLGISSYWLER